MSFNCVDSFLTLKSTMTEQMLVRGIRDSIGVLQILQALITAFVYIPKLDGKSLLLKTTHVFCWVRRREEIKLIPTCRLHLNWLTFTGLESSTYTKQLTQLWRFYAAMIYDLVRNAHWCNNVMKFIKVTNYFTLRFKALF